MGHEKGTVISRNMVVNMRVADVAVDSMYREGTSYRAPVPRDRPWPLGTEAVRDR